MALRPTTSAGLGDFEGLLVDSYKEKGKLIMEGNSLFSFTVQWSNVPACVVPDLTLQSKAQTNVKSPILKP